MLANDLAQTVADFGAAVVPVGGLRRKLLRLVGSACWLGKGTDLFDRADADSIRFAQGAIDRPCFGHPHLGAVNKEGNIRRIGVAVSNEAFASLGLVDRGLERPTLCRRIANG